ncbi:hypothetical protein GCM10027037_11120 [Mucilaginibacter koreensis]
MEQEFEAILTGSDSQIEGNVVRTNADNFGDVYKFTSFDGSLELVIAKNEGTNWERVAGTDPYFSGWVDELAEQIESNKQQII